MPEWLEIVVKVGPLIIGFGVGLLQLYLSNRFSEFKEKIDQKIDTLETRIEAKYPARDIIDLLVGGIKERLEKVEKKVEESPRRTRQ